MRRVFIPATIALEVVALIDRVLETGTQFTRPALYVAWSATGLSTAMFFLVLIAIAVGTVTAIMSSITLLAQTHAAIEDAIHIRARKVRVDSLASLRQRVRRYQVFIGGSFVLFVVLGVVYFLAGRLTWLGLVGTLVDIVAPFWSMVVVGMTERDHDRRSPQQHAMAAASAKLVDSVGAVQVTDGKLSHVGADLLRSGKDGDLDGMLSAMTERDADDTYYTIAAICQKLNVSADRDSPDRKRIYRVIARARAAGAEGIRLNPRTHAVEVPGALWDRLFGAFEPAPAIIRLMDVARSRPARDPAPELESDGQQEDNMVRFPTALHA